MAASKKFTSMKAFAVGISASTTYTETIDFGISKILMSLISGLANRHGRNLLEADKIASMSDLLFSSYHSEMDS
jgi:hypothetical protein